MYIKGGKKRERKEESRNIWRDKCNTTLTKSDEKSLSFIYGEIRFIIRRAFSFHFLKGAFWQTLCSGRHTHKTCCHGAIWIWWQAHYHIEDSWQHRRGEMDRAANQRLKRLWLKQGFLFQEQWYKLTALILFIRAAHTVVKGWSGFPLSTPVCRRFISWPRKNVFPAEICQRSGPLPTTLGRVCVCARVRFTNSLSSCQNQAWREGNKTFSTDCHSVVTVEGECAGSQFGIQTRDTEDSAERESTPWKQPL